MDKPIDRLLARCAPIRQGVNPYLIFGAVFLSLNILIDPTVSGFITETFRLYIPIGVLCIAAFGFYLWLEGRLTHERTVVLIMAVGVLVRIVYVFYTGIYTRQHDTGGFEGSGHLGYIKYFTLQWMPPDSNGGQFYHPPLHYLLAAVWYRINDFFDMGNDRNIESIQYLTAFYSSCFMVVAHRIFKQLNIKGVFLLLATAIVSLHPSLFIFAGSLNNDALAALLYISAFLWLLKWWNEQSVKNIAVLALCVGLGMMTKLNDATLAFVIAPFFIAKLITSGQAKARMSLLINFMLFGVISIPLGLWHSVRNLLLFRQPLGYVLELPIDSWVYRGIYSPIQRIFSVSFSQLFARLYADPRWDYNLPIYILKTSLFGEWKFNADMNTPALVLISLNLILIIMSLVAMVYMIIRKRGGNTAMYLMLHVLWLVQIISFAYFYFNYPFSCAMDFRYIVPSIVSGAGFIGLACQYISENLPKIWENKRHWVFVPVTLFCLFSVYFFLFM